VLGPFPLVLPPSGFLQQPKAGTVVLRRNLGVWNDELISRRPFAPPSVSIGSDWNIDREQARSWPWALFFASDFHSSGALLDS